MGSKRPVRVSVGKTHHQAWLVEGVVDQHGVQKRNDEQVLIQWESVRYTEWVPRSSVHFEIPSLRRRPATKSETRNRSHCSAQTVFSLTKKPDCAVQHSDMSTFIRPHRPQPIKIPLNHDETSDQDGTTGACPEDQQILKNPRVLEFSDVTRQSDANTTMPRPKQMESPCQNGHSVTTEEHKESKSTEIGYQPQETRTSTPVPRHTESIAKDFRKENHMGKNILKSRQNIKFKSKHKSFTLRDLEQDGNFTETQLRVFNELLTGKTLFSPPSLKELRRTLSCAKKNQKSFFLRDKH